jgi:tRNA (mo5U34)-methyltransferase
VVVTTCPLTVRAGHAHTLCPRLQSVYDRKGLRGFGRKGSAVEECPITRWWAIPTPWDRYWDRPAETMLLPIIRTVTSPAELQAQTDRIEWFHTIDLGNGVITKGIGVQETGAEILPDVSGRSVLDIGAWDGKFSFLAEQAGASRLVALDHYAWGVDMVARGAYWSECIEKGILPDQSRDETEFWRPELPGRRGFEFAAAALNSKVEPVVADFQTVDLHELGQFDVVLYLGVLYHMKDPLTSLERLRVVTKEVAVIETEAVHLQGLDHEALLQFHAGSTLRTDFGNWYVPTIAALHNLCRAAGFSNVHTLVGPPAPPPPEPSPRRRLGRRDQRILPLTSAPSENYRAIVHAFV